MNEKQNIIEYSRTLGFDKIGFVKPNALPNELQHLEEWLASGYNASMEWFHKRKDTLANPFALLDNLQTIVVTANAYPAKVDFGNTKMKIAKYAVLPDYHKRIKASLKNLDAFLFEEYNATSRYFVDSGVLLEKYWATAAGIGWQGKHSLIITPEFGSYINIGILLTTLAIEPDEPAKNHCGNCSKCIEACPSNAIVKPAVIDCNNCITYHNIENRGERSSQIMAAIRTSEYIYGCDICADVCPFNSKIATKSEEFHFDLPELLSGLSKENFDERMSGYPLKRPGYESLRLCIAAME
ncbi:MAG: tRNA epoxyqueuosine(34) reductase QueG [Ignavibacteria bacterium]|jgi:epoxyqueuosine reductase|nr:tRNA epoxyqueuosine(34) reductase QueG [Ignavibacteria bacterium]